MKTSFKIHAGLQLGLGGVALLASALTLLPGRPLVTHTGLFLAVCFALLVPLHAGTIFRSIALHLRSGSRVSDKALQWQALRNLPRPVHVFLIGAGVAAAALLASTGSGDRLSGAEAAQGRYTAVDTTDPRRERVTISRTAYDRLHKEDQRSMFTVFGLLAVGGGAFTLTVAELDASGRSRTPDGSAL
ncbi:hypothetical protein ACFVU3_32355 [Streptomyces sp. NPDC058052]|uniref:hypothetical protein n=1 Tax=Streptomyces sp. NPDC058052 TaxID=3346316 RepID=UPI0036E374AF